MTVITIHEDEGYRTGILAVTGRKFLGVIWPDAGGIKINRVPIDGAKYTEIDYNLEKAKKALRKCGRNFGITKEAKRALRAA